MTQSKERPPHQFPITGQQFVLFNHAGCLVHGAREHEPQ
jgi:hypothetical protein